MTCAILTPERIEQLLSGRLPAADRAALKDHLAAPCEACLEALAAVDGERILAALAGPAAELTAAESDRLFAAALPAEAPRAAAAPAASPWARLIEWMGAAAWRPALALAAVVLLVLPALWIVPGTPAGWDGVKGAGGPTVQANLIGVIGGRFNGRPFMSRRAAMREQLKPGEVLLVRFRLTSPAAVHLRLSGPKASLGVWADGRADSQPQPQLLPAGEHALVAGGQVLAVKAEEYGSPLRVTLTASPSPFPTGLVPQLGALAQDPAKLAGRCPGCAVDVLEVLPPPEGVLPEESFK